MERRKKKSLAVGKKNHFDFIIIGGGSAGLSAAIRADELGIKTLMINAGLPLGGTCLNVGCIPSKRLLYIGELIQNSRTRHFAGVDIAVKKINFSAIIKETQEFVTNWRQQDEHLLASLKKVTYKRNWAQFISPHEIRCGKSIFSADKFLIATGSTAYLPPFEGIENVQAITHEQAFKLKKLPKSLTIIGAGAVGLECAQLFARFGSKVTLLERGQSIFSSGDKEIIAQLHDLLSHEGIKIKTGAVVTKAIQHKNKKILSYQYHKRHYNLESDEVLIAAGKVPNTHILAVTQAGVTLDEHGAIKVNNYLKTSQSHIFAAGDVIKAPLRLETTAAQEGRIAVDNAFVSAKKSVDYTTVPFGLFTDPQYAFVGRQDLSAHYESLTLSLQDIPKATITKQTNGTLKMIVDNITGEIYSVHILSSYAADLIVEAMQLIQNKNTLSDLRASLPTYPTLSQAFKICALSSKESS